MSFIVYHDAVFLRHAGPAQHPERPDRLKEISKALASCAHGTVEIRSASRAAKAEEICLVHAEEYYERICATSGKPLQLLDPDTYAGPESFDVARIAAGTLLDAVDVLQKDTGGRVFACVRPPGHHAETRRPMGFCLFNNAAIAAEYARRKYRLPRVAIYDFDVHHGNGTQEIFYLRPDVLYLSHHQFPFYPGTGDWREVGEGEGRGFTINVPLAAGAGDADIRVVWEELFAPILKEFDPSILILSAGFDAHENDPLGGLKMTDAGFRSLFRGLESFAHARKIPLLYALEGGYNPGVIARNVAAALSATTDEESAAEIPGDAPRTESTIESLRTLLKEQWKF